MKIRIVIPSDQESRACPELVEGDLRGTVRRSAISFALLFSQKKPQLLDWGTGGWLVEFDSY